MSIPAKRTIAANPATAAIMRGSRTKINAAVASVLGETFGSHKALMLRAVKGVNTHTSNSAQAGRTFAATAASPPIAARPRAYKPSAISNWCNRVSRHPRKFSVAHVGTGACHSCTKSITVAGSHGSVRKAIGKAATIQAIATNRFRLRGLIP